MRLVFLSDHMKFSGGRRLMFDYARYLMRKGHDVKVLVIKKKGELVDYVPAEVVPNFHRKNIPECDLIIATSPKEVRLAYKAAKGKVVHFCQGIELIDLEQRISEKVLPIRYQGTGLLHKLKILEKKFTWKRKSKEYDKIYKLPTTLIAITKPIQKQLEDRYHRPVYLCQNGVNLELFKPNGKKGREQKLAKDNPLKIISIGPINVTYKGIQTTINAVEKARQLGLHISFIRISPSVDLEVVLKNDNDKLYINLSQAEVSELLKESDLYVSNSTEREGFGLPAMEALASGLICILSDITSYRSFSDRKDYCIFVPEGDVQATVDAIRKVYSMTADEIETMQKNALEVAARFSHDKACENFERILNEINSQN